MGFLKLEQRWIKDVLYISVNQSLIYLPRWTHEKMDKVKRVDIYYDPEISAIKLIPSEAGRIIRNYKNNYRGIAVKISHLMLKGKYYYINNTMYEFRRS